MPSRDYYFNDGNYKKVLFPLYLIASLIQTHKLPALIESFNGVNDKKKKRQVIFLYFDTCWIKQVDSL